MGKIFTGTNEHKVAMNIHLAWHLEMFEVEKVGGREPGCCSASLDRDTTALCEYLLQ